MFYSLKSDLVCLARLHTNHVPNSRQVFLKPRNPLPRRIIHRLLILLTTPITPQREPMDLILIHLDLTRTPLLLQNLLDTLHTLRIQQTIPVPQRQTQRPIHGVEIPRNRHQARMTRVRRIHTANLTICSASGLEYRVAPAPAETDRPDLVRAGDMFDGIDKPADHRLTDPLAVLDQPRPQRRRDDRRVLALVDDAHRLLVFERGFDVLQETQGKAVAGV